MRQKSESERAAVLREFEMSGLSLAEFCRQAGLAYSTVLVWRRKAREAAALSPPVFVEVEALPSGPAADPPDGRGMVVEDGQPVDDGTDNGDMEQTVEREGRGAPEVPASLSGREPPWLVELALPGGLLLRIHAPCPDRGGGQRAGPPCGDFPASAVRKGGLP